MAKKAAKVLRTVLVTGGSRGLGLGIARALTAAGYRVITVARKPTKELTAAIAQTKRGKTGSLDFVAFDLGKIDEIPGLVRNLRDEFGPLSGLVVLTKYVVRGMMSKRSGRIVDVASIIGFTGYGGLSVYAATKASMLGFTRSLAREVGRLGITVNAVAPGFLDTDMTHGLAGAQREQVVRRSALRRLAGVDDAVTFLLSDKAQSISGTTLTVDAGATA